MLPAWFVHAVFLRLSEQRRKKFASEKLFGETFNSKTEYNIAVKNARGETGRF